MSLTTRAGFRTWAGMKRATVFMGLFAMIGVASAKETVIKPQIEWVGLFKNGLCMVKGSFPATEPGEFLWDEPLIEFAPRKAAPITPKRPRTR